jgi:asparagine synthase (glutamine-hydrolysing)
MFAFAIWDGTTRKIILARDRVGKKPLVYSQGKDWFIFASEIKALLGFTVVSKEIDWTAVYDYFSYGYIPNPKTIYSKVKKLRPAHYAILDEQSGSFVEKRYWDISFKPDYSKTEIQWEQELHSILQEAVRYRLVSDVPVGFFLSGGIDSSSIVAYASLAAKHRLRTFSIGFEGKLYDEMAWAHEVAREFDTEHTEKYVHFDALSLLPKIAYGYDEPFGDSSAIPTYILSNATRGSVKVALSGDGGDETFLGYKSYEMLQKMTRVLRIPFKLRRMLSKPLLSVYPSTVKGYGTISRFASPPQSVHKYLQGKQFAMTRLFREDIRALIGSYEDHFFEEKYKHGPKSDMLAKSQYLDVWTYLTDNILVKVDRASMMNSLEVRIPFLDHKLLEFAATIPSHLKLRIEKGSVVSKYILKKALCKFYSQAFLNRPKGGFGGPIDLWMKHELYNYMLRDILVSDSEISRLFDTKAVEGYLKAHRSGRRNLSRGLWWLIAFEHWARAYKHRL